jgi:hypothetical protein
MAIETSGDVQRRLFEQFANLIPVLADEPSQFVDHALELWALCDHDLRAKLSDFVGQEVDIHGTPPLRPYS